MRNNRSCGVLLHPTSLPGQGGIGTLGDNARQFVDLLAAMGMSWWQVLPLNPPSCGNSPYSAFSAFAGNPLLIDLRDLAVQGDLLSGELPQLPCCDRIDFAAVTACKEPLLRAAATRFFAAAEQSRLKEFWRFCDTTFLPAFNSTTSSVGIRIWPMASSRPKAWMRFIEMPGRRRS